MFVHFRTAFVLVFEWSVLQLNLRLDSVFHALVKRKIVGFRPRLAIETAFNDLAFRKRLQNRQQFFYLFSVHAFYAIDC